jgi:hypothetical protein
MRRTTKVSTITVPNGSANIDVHCRRRRLTAAGTCSPILGDGEVKPKGLTVTSTSFTFGINSVGRPSR